MISEGTNATTLEKGIIIDYNSKLTSAIAAFETANEGVRSKTFPIHVENCYSRKHVLTR